MQQHASLRPAEAPRPHLDALVARATALARPSPPRLGIVFPCDALAMRAAAAVQEAGLGDVVLVGPRHGICAAAAAASVDPARFAIEETGSLPLQAAGRAVFLAGRGQLAALMKGSLHTDELMSAVVARRGGLRASGRISHTFVFDLPRYPKLLAVADCVVNIAPDLEAKSAILGNALRLLHTIEVRDPKVGIVAAVETVTPAIRATLDARILVAMAQAGTWPGAIVEGPLAFDNVISAEAARIKNIESQVAGRPDLLLVPDLNAGNLLYKSFIYMGGGECAGLVLGARVPVILTSRADSQRARIASAALAVLMHGSGGREASDPRDLRQGQLRPHEAEVVRARDDRSP